MINLMVQIQGKEKSYPIFINNSVLATLKESILNQIEHKNYIVVINQLGCDPIYDRRTHFNSAQTYFDADKKTIYEIDDTMPELDDVCDKILRIMYNR